MGGGGQAFVENDMAGFLYCLVDDEDVLGFLPLFMQQTSSCHFSITKMAVHGWRQCSRSIYFRTGVKTSREREGY